MTTTTKSRLAATALTDTPDPSTVIDHDYVVTNNTIIDIVALDSFNKTNPVVPQVMYEQSLSYLTPKDSSTSTVKASAKATLDLKDTHLGSDNTTVMPNTRYAVIFARADNLCPVATAAVKLDTNYLAAPIIVAEADRQDMILAQKFYQYMTAFPTSATAKGYVAAVNDAQTNGESVAEMDAAVTKFFQGTDDYKTLTLEKVLAVSTYYAQYPIVWTDNKPSKTYYLYSSDGTKITDMGFVKLALGTITPGKDLTGFSFVYTDASGKTTNLSYSKGQLVEDITLDLPTICLQGLFTQRSTFTKSTDDTAIITALSGTVNGYKVLGYDTKQTPDSDDSTKWSGLYTLLHPKDAMGVIQLFMTIMGVVMGIDFICKMLKGNKDAATDKADKDGRDPSSVEMDQIKSNTKAQMEQIKAENQKMLDKFQDQLKESSDNINDAIENLKTEITEQIDASHADLLMENFKTQDALLDKLNDLGANDDNMEYADDNIRLGESKLNNATNENRGSVVEEVSPMVDANNGYLKLTEANLDAHTQAQIKSDYDKMNEDYLDDVEQRSNFDDDKTKTQNDDDTDLSDDDWEVID